MMNSQDTVYVLDTNILIELSVWLPIELNKIFWDKLEEALKNGKWVLLDVVAREIKYGNDGLQKWCERQYKVGLYTILDDSHRERAVSINEEYQMIDESSLRSTVDTYLIAYAEQKKYTIFTREGFRRSTTDLYKIPDVCNRLNIRCIRRPQDFYIAIGYKG